MAAVVADTGPLRYLVLIDAVDVLPHLFERVIIPDTVGAELDRPSTPLAVREWLSAMPEWLGQRADPPALGMLPPQLGAGERAAIGLAHAIGAPLLIDDRIGIKAARARDIEATGTLGVLVRAAQMRPVNLRTAFARLRDTNFRHRQELLDELLTEYKATKP